MLDIEGLSLNDSDRVLLGHPMVGGLILFTRNFESTQQLQKLISEIRAANPHIIIAVDHEGGRVQRFKSEFTLLPAMAKLGELYEHDRERALFLSQEFAWLMAAELICFDIDISFAPILDRNHGISAIIGDRAFSSSILAITSLTEAFCRGMHDAGMASTGKHFPGHGSVEADSHIAIPVDHRDFQDIDTADMAVFSKVIECGIDAMMPAHVIYPSVDDQPAGFSHIWLQDILRKKLKFDGVIFSDDLGMEGATVGGSFENRAKLALEAGCDMILVCNNRQGALEVLTYLEDQNLEPSQRLPSMRHSSTLSRTSTTLAKLKQSARWQKAHKAIESLRITKGV